MKQFRNIFIKLSPFARVDFRKMVYVRRAKLIEEGYEVNHVNWDHYAKVLEVKHQSLTTL